MTIRSPFTQDSWSDLRIMVGTLSAFAHKFHRERPRRRPRAGWDDAIANAIKASSAYASLVVLERTGDAGIALSDVYWLANQAEKQLRPFLPKAFAQLAVYINKEWLENAPEDAAQNSSERAEHFAWWALQLTRRGATNELSLDSYETRTILGGTIAELDYANVPAEGRQRTERVSRFFSVAGRFPETPADRELFDAFEAALEADEADFAVHLARHGWGQPDDA